MTFSTKNVEPSSPIFSQLANSKRLTSKQKDIDQRLQDAVAKHGTEGKGVWGKIGQEIGLTPQKSRGRWAKLKIDQKKQDLWSPQVLERMQRLIEQSNQPSKPNVVEICHALDQEFGEVHTYHDCQQYIEALSRPFQKKTIHSKWSRVEDDQLINLIEKYGVGKWALIAQEMKNRSDAQCRLRWLNHLGPTINHGPWSKAEDDQLRSLVEKYGVGNWALIAQKMKNRSDAQCRNRWLNHLDPTINHGHWSETEDDQLRSLVEKYGVGNWVLIAQEMKTRSDAQCRPRWLYQLDPTINHGSWSKAEDNQLGSLVAKYGVGKWMHIAQEMKNRSGVQCRLRWLRYLDPTIKFGPWSKAEDDQLRSLVAKYGVGKWMHIAQEMKNRSDAQCRNRWLCQLDPTINHGPWSKAEDDQLRSLVAKYGVGKWMHIAQEMKNRSDAQCRSRWLNHLDPSFHDQARENHLNPAINSAAISSTTSDTYVNRKRKRDEEADLSFENDFSFEEDFLIFDEENDFEIESRDEPPAKRQKMK